MAVKFKLIVETDLDQIVRSLQRLNTNYQLGLFLYKELVSAAVWSLSNCILTAIVLDENRTELKLHPPGLMPPSDKAGKTWNEIGQLFLDIGWISEFTPILIDDQSDYLNQFFKLVRLAESPGEMDLEITEKPLEPERERAKAFLREHDRVTSMTIEERAEDWLARLGLKESTLLSELEHGIISVCRELREERLPISDARIAARLAIGKGIRNKQGKPYSRRWICEVRNRLIKKGHDLKV